MALHMEQQVKFFATDLWFLRDLKCNGPKCTDGLALVLEVMISLTFVGKRNCKSMLIRSLFERGADGLHSSKKKIILPFVTQGTMEEEGNMSFAPHGRRNILSWKC